MFRELEKLFQAVYIMLLISVPLAIWKLVDIVIWLYNNVKITVGD